MKLRKIYLASSWRNKQQPAIVVMLREMGHEVYDFRNPAPDNTGFAWTQCGVDMRDKGNYVSNITRNSVARAGFKLDQAALNWCDTCILLLPCGRSAHLEAGYAIGQGKETFIVLNDEGFEPELMYLLAAYICDDVNSLHDALTFSTHRACKACW